MEEQLEAASRASRAASAEKQELLVLCREAYSELMGAWDNWQGTVSKGVRGHVGVLQA